MKTTKKLSRSNETPSIPSSVSRRVAVCGLVSPVVAASLHGWGIKPSPIVVVRNGWVLSKDD